MGNNLEYQKAFFYIVDKIKSGELGIGSKLPAERELTEVLGISRSSTREAISILSGMGLIESKHGSGNYICNNTEETVKHVVDLMIALGSITEKELFDYRKTVSVSVGALLISEGISKEAADELTRIIEAMKCATDEEFCQLDREFHLELIKASGNTLFMTVMEPIGELYFDMIVNVIMSSEDREREIRVPLHENILTSILERDMTGFMKAIKDHYEFVESRLKR